MKKKETPEKKKKEPIYQNKTTLTVYLVLRALVIFGAALAVLRIFKPDPIWVMVGAGALGGLLYSIM